MNITSKSRYKKTLLKCVISWDLNKFKTKKTSYQIFKLEYYCIFKRKNLEIISKQK